MKKTIIIGGGPAGIMAAGAATEKGNRVLLFEKNEKLGKKLYITGKGRCNLTNASTVDVLLENIPANPYFMYSSLYTLDSFGLMGFFKERGLSTKIERGNRVFPVSEKSSDVIKTLEKYLRKLDVEIILNCGIKEIEHDGKKISGVITDKNEFYEADSIIIATGGLSYPMTGSTGDGYKFAQNLGHRVTKLYPSLVSLLTKEEWLPKLQGLSLKNVGIDVVVGGKTIYKDFGEMLFTHKGVSGPMILSASRRLVDKYDKKSEIFVDLKPALDEKELDKRILRDFEKYINRDFANSLDDLLPQKLISVIVELSGISSTLKVNEIKKEQRKILTNMLKKLKITIKGSGGFDEAVITAGGVCVDEIDPGTMESKIVDGLYFVGEVLDVDGLTGGFNLQIAFSTGYLAGLNV